MTPEEKLMAARTGKLRFTLAEAQAASEEWGFNCGPGALCAVLGETPASIRSHLGDFERKRYLNPMLMEAILRDLKVPFKRVYQCLGAKKPSSEIQYPQGGLVRMQWGGPWTMPGVPTRKRYRHTHWIGLRNSTNGREAFDINAMSAGGWIKWNVWCQDLVPWLLDRVEPQNDKTWWPTHCLEIKPAEVKYYSGGSLCDGCGEKFCLSCNPPV